MAVEKVDRAALENMASDIAKLLCGRLPHDDRGISLHTESVTLKSRTVIQVFASTANGNGLFTINLEMKNFSPSA